MALSAATRLGPYEILEPLGAGGVGEVYRARDPRLSRDVAVKLISTDGPPSPDRLRRFETEARAAAQLSHPNVVTVFDVGSHEGQPYLVLELLEGETLSQTLRTGLPPLRQAVTWALDISRGLAAAHERGIVHRDLKPDNVFLTSDGRVKILDFGLARLVRDEGAPGEGGESGSQDRTGTAPGTILGALGHLSPEVVRGQEVDARSDVFALGAVLYEMISGKRAFSGPTPADTLSAILHQEPPPLVSPSGPVPPALQGIVRRCLEKAPHDRFHSAQDVALALEAVGDESAAKGRAGEEERRLYPGLGSFTEEDAGHFFGREGEVEALWERLATRTLLAVIAPSGAGKTSFLRAGVVASRPRGWGVIVSTPGSRALRGLGEALAPEMASDPDALRKLLDFEETAFELLTRWRSRHTEALVVVDQFEELFTLNSPETQGAFSELLGRLSTEGDVHVVLSMRDDFLFRCSDHEPLARVFRELTPLPTLGGDALRRAVEEPARREGFSLEDGLVDEMLQAVEGSRGALPLLAFAVSRLWEKRDRQRRLLTRAAYEEIGGVAGALAQHAEQALDRIGREREPLVREIFRNLVTAQGTRVSSEREELLSVFPERSTATEVLQELIAARLLTSYEVPVSAGEVEEQQAPPRSRYRIEIVHESLLKAWPRLVWWQAQDEEGAQLRDQLKQAAHLWDEKGRSPDLLWAGEAFQEFALWRRRYPGQLTAVEEEFARAMVDRARRRKQVRRAVVAGVFVVLLAVLTVIGGLWRRSATEARRAEASKLLALGRVELETHPTAALAYARKSLELVDTFEARKFTLEVLWRGPVARILPVHEAAQIDRDWGIISDLVPSPDGRWLALLTYNNQDVVLVPPDGGPARALPRRQDRKAIAIDFSPQSDLLITGGPGHSLSLWSLPDLREVRRVELGGIQSGGWVRSGRLLTFTRPSTEAAYAVVRAWPLPQGEPSVQGRVTGWPWDIDPTGTRMAFFRGREVRVRPLDDWRPEAERVLGTSRDEVRKLTFAPTGDRLATIDNSDEVRLWSLDSSKPGPLRVFEGARGPAGYHFNGDGSALATGTADGALHVWDFDEPPDAQHAVLRRPDEVNLFPVAFDPGGRWVIASDGRAVAFWPLSSPRMRTLPGSRAPGYWLPFSADGRWLASCGDAARVWPLDPGDGSVRTLAEPCRSVAVHPASTHVLVGRQDVALVPIEGGRPRQLLDRWDGANQVAPVAFDVEGRRAVAAPVILGGATPEQRILRMWDLESGEEQRISFAEITDDSWSWFTGLAFAPDGSLFLSGNGGVHRLTLPDGPGAAVSSELVHAQTWTTFDLSADGRYLLALGLQEGDFADVGYEELILFDLQEHSSRRITTHGRRVRAATLDAERRAIVTVDIDGVVRVGPMTGEEPHLLFGQAGGPTALDVSPDGRWIASQSSEVIHLWPMPDVTKPPFHTLPHEDLMAKLEAHTNLRVVEDDTSPTGYTLEVGPFPGWEEVPEW